VSKLSTRPFMPVGSFESQAAAKTKASIMRKDTGQDWRAAKRNGKWGIKRVR
jgi:hypothetical protein